MEDDEKYEDVLDRLKSGSRKRDPRSIRLAAVTSAILDVIGTDLTAAKVYAKAVGALEGTLSGDKMQVSDSLVTQGALLELLVVTIPHVIPAAIISATLPATSRVLRGCISACIALGGEISTETKDELGGINACLRWTCRVATEILRRLDSKASETACKELYLGTLIAAFSDKRPKVRKAAQNGAIELLRMEGPSCHPIITKTTSAYIRTELKKCTKTASESSGELLHILGFLEQSISLVNYEKLGPAVMEILTSLLETEASDISPEFVLKIKENTPKVLAIGAALSVLTALVKEHVSLKSKFVSGFVPRVLATLLQVKPALVFRKGKSEADILDRSLYAYGECIISSTRCTLMVDVNLGVKMLPLSTQMVVLLCRADPDAVRENLDMEESLMIELTQLFRERIPALLSAGHSDLPLCLESSLRALEPLLQTHYQPIWSVALKCLVAFVNEVSSKEMSAGLLEGLIRLRIQSSEKSTLTNVVDDAVLLLFQKYGTESYWSWIKWTTDGAKGIHVERAWLISIVKSAAGFSHMRRPNLAFFQNHVLVLARECDKLATTNQKHCNFYHNQVSELWSLFPVLCKTSNDIAASLDAIVSTLCAALEDNRYPQLLATIASGLFNLCKLTEEHGSEADSLALSAAAVKLVPVFFKIVTNRTESLLGEKPQLEGANGSAVADSIAALCKFADVGFLSGLFKKLMQRLLQEIQNQSSSSSKIGAFLSLSQSLVSSRVLDEASVSFLYRTLKPLLQTDLQDARVQKRAYKVLAELCECHHSFFSQPEPLKEILALMSESSKSAHVSARHMRLKCLNILVDGFDDSQMERVEDVMLVLPEVLVSLKDANAKNRDAGYQLLLSLAARKERQGFLQAITAALGAETSHMRSAAVMALSRVIFEFAWEDATILEILPSLLRTVLVLIDENSREVIKSTIGFIRISVAAIPPEQLQPLLPELVGGLLHYHKAKSRFRSKIKIIIKKLVRLFGYEALLEYVPDTETRLISHIRKLDEREERKKAMRKEKAPDAEGFDKMLDSDEEDSDDGRTFVTGATGFTRFGATSRGSVAMSRGTKKTSTTARSKVRAETNVSLAEQDGNPIDMLGSKFGQQAAFDDSESDSDGAMEFDDSGRLIVHEEEQSGNEELEENVNKRRRVDEVDDRKRAEGGNVKRRQRQKKDLGASYKSKKAGGDVKRKNQRFEPYAYVPLDGKSYSKKNRRNAVDQMSSVVRKGGKRKR